MRSDAEKNTLLPMTTDLPLKSDDKLFKGSAMSQRGAYAALSYMSCAGIFFPEDCLRISF